MLVDYQNGGTFNQYRDVHPHHDLADGAAIRLGNLQAYLDEFTEIRYVLLAEAAGYQGCRFSGIPMTSEAQITGPEALPWAREAAFARSSARKRPWREPSATILWATLGGRRDCLIWNTFPWHPVGKRGPLSNRTPRRGEMLSGMRVLERLLGLYPGARPIAIGRIAEKALRELGADPLYIRHPAHGGKPDFEAGIKSLPRPWTRP